MTASKTADAGTDCATRVATRRNADCSAVRRPVSSTARRNRAPSTATTTTVARSTTSTTTLHGSTPEPVDGRSKATTTTPTTATSSATLANSPPTKRVKFGPNRRPAISLISPSTAH